MTPEDDVTTAQDDVIHVLEDIKDERERSLREVLADDRYEIVSANHDPANGSYIIMAERDPRMSTSLAFKEMGYTSLSPWTAWTREEHVPELRDKQGIRTYYEMKRADGTVRGALRYVKTPVMAARWFLEPASDSTLDHNIAAFVEDNLFNKLNVPWGRVIEDALLMCEYGFIVFEKVYDQDNDGRIVLKKLAPRHPLDIREWIYDDNGGPQTLVMEPTEATGWIQLEIPIAKLVVFVLEQEAGDLRGISLLRSAYKHYYYRETFYKIDCVDEDTEIFTQTGWKRYNEVKIGDMTLSINTNTGLSEWDTVEAVHQSYGTHNMTKMDSRVFSAMTTPDHRWWVRNKRSHSWKWKTTETLSYLDQIPKSAIFAEIPSELQTYCPEYTANEEEYLNYESGMKITEEEYEGTVWCVSTKNKNWLARRGGSVYYTGNSIQKERHGIGVPIIKLPMGFSKADRAIAEDLGRNLRTNERAHIVAPESWTIEFAKLEGQPVDCLTSIAHHDMKIYENILAPFANDPSAKEDSMSMFFKSTRYIANTVADTFNKYVIKQLVDFNFVRGKYPKLRARRIGEWEDLRTMSFAYRNFVGANSIIPDERLEDFLRREMDLPPAEHETRRITTASPQAPTATPPDEGHRTATGSDVAPPGPPRAGLPRQAPPSAPTTGNKMTGIDKSGTSGTR